MDTPRGFNTSLLLSTVCLLLVCVGGWYFQSTLMIQQQEILEQKQKVVQQAELIQTLNEKLLILETRKFQVTIQTNILA